MKKLLEFLIDFLRDKNNGSSYKRLTGFACFITAIAIAFINQNSTLCGMFLAVSMGESIATLFEKKDK